MFYLLKPSRIDSNIIGRRDTVSSSVLVELGHSYRLTYAKDQARVYPE